MRYGGDKLYTKMSNQRIKTIYKIGIKLEGRRVNQLRIGLLKMSGTLDKRWHHRMYKTLLVSQRRRHAHLNLQYHYIDPS